MAPFGSLWLTFGATWLPFGSLWLPFGSLLVPFGSLLVPLGSLLLALALDFLTLGVFWRHFFNFFEFSLEIICKIAFFLKNLIEIQFVLFFSAFEALSAKHPRTIPGTLAFAPNHL